MQSTTAAPGRAGHAHSLQSCYNRAQGIAAQNPDEQRYEERLSETQQRDDHPCRYDNLRKFSRTSVRLAHVARRLALRFSRLLLEWA